MLSGIILIDRRFWIEVGEKVERASRPARKQTLRGPGKEAQQICLGKTVQVDDEIKLAAAYVFDDLEDSQNRKRFESVSQLDPVNLHSRVGITGHVDYLSAGPADNYGDTRMRKALANRAQRRQAHDHVAQLAEIDDEDVARFKCHFKCLSKNSAPAWYPRSQS